MPKCSSISLAVALTLSAIFSEASPILIPTVRTIVSVGYDKTVCLWDASTGEAILPPLKHDKPVFCAAFSPDAARLVTASGDNIIRLWDISTGQEVVDLRGHQSYVKSIAFTLDGKRLISGSGDFTVRVWNAP